MFARLKSLSKQSIVYGLGNLLPKVISFFLIPLYTHFLTPADYAVLSVVSTFNGLLGIFSRFGMTGAITRFHYDFLEDESAQRTYYGTVWVFLTGVSLAITLCLNWQGELLFSILFKNVAFRPYGQLAIWLTFMQVAGIIPLIRLRVQGKAPIYSAFTVSRFLFNTLTIILFVSILRQGAVGSLRAQLLIAAVYAIPFTVITLNNLQLTFDWHKLKELLKFGLPLVPHQLSGWTLAVSDQILLERFASLEQLGLYALGYKFGTVLDLILSSINMAWTPFFYRTAQTEDNTSQTFARLMTYYMVFVFMIGLGLALGSKEVIILMTNKNYHDAYKVVPVLVLASIIRGFYFMNVNALFFTKQTKRLPVFTILSAISNISLNILFLPHFGILAAAWARVAGYIVLTSLVYWESHRIYPISYEYLRLCVLSLLAVCIFALGQFFTFASPLLNLTAKFLVVGLMPITLFVFGFFTPRELAGIRLGLQSILERLKGTAKNGV